MKKKKLTWREVELNPKLSYLQGVDCEMAFKLQDPYIDYLHDLLIQVMLGKPCPIEKWVEANELAKSIRDGNSKESEQTTRQ